MTGDVEELLQISQQLDSAFITSSNTMGAVEDTCIYTATIPAQLAPSFPQGSILRIMPDSAIVAVAVKNSNESYSSSKESSFPIEHLLATTQQPQAMVDEEDDIDLSFLNDAAENAMMSDSAKCLTTTDLNLLQGPATEQPKSVEEQERLKDLIDQSAADVVMIDVTKPIPLSQNSLIMVNGQKCVLQHDSQTGQVLAYPVKEQEKSRKRRGRPRKEASVEQHTEKESEQPNKNESNSKRDAAGNGSSEEEREKGLQEIVNDDGALVRRSSRKRKKARILRDYETGNLRQELGSDVEESADLDADICSNKKKVRGPGRPRKYTDGNTGMKRLRGRPKKTTSESSNNEEPTQAFLVQTADGQALMMQVPLSSIPAGISLQQMAQEIADKLNLGLNQASNNNHNNNPVVAETKESSPSDDLKSVPEVALQDHSVGSTTNHFPPSVPSSSAENSLLVDVIDPSSDMVCASEEVIFESENSAKEVFSSIHQNDLSTLEVVPSSEDHFAIHLPSSAETVDSTSTVTVYSHFDPLTDHDFCLPRSHVTEIVKNNIETTELFDQNDAVKNNKVSITLLLPNKNSDSDPVVLSAERPVADQHLKPSIECVSDSVNKNLLEENGLPIEENAALNNEDISSTVPASNAPVLGLDVNAGAKQCKICKMPYLKDEEIIEHFKANHPKCICAECHYMNEHPYIIKRHVLRHGNQGCVCKICNKKYKDMYILKMHIKMVHLPPDVLYACEICDKKFTRKAHLKRHLRIHAPVKQYQCPHCDYKGCEKSDITKHLLIHEEPKFKCEVCGKAFRHLKNKELHLKRHSGQRDYKCAACGFFGYTYTDIRKHIERRHSVQNQCPQCKQAFSDVELFKDHQRSCLVDKNNEIKILESHSIAIVSKEAAFSDEMPLDILDQPQVMCSEETLSALQNGQLVMTLEDIITSSVDDKEKMIAVVTTDGSNPLESSSSLPLENVSVAIDRN